MTPGARGGESHLVAKGMGLGVRPGPGLITALPRTRWATLLTSLSLSFLLCKASMITERFHQLNVSKEAGFRSSQCLSAVRTVTKAERTWALLSGTKP